MPEPLLLWRAYVPRWAYLPLSGEGAARFGGRWNPVGAPTIYAAREMSTAWAEYNQGFAQHPALIVRLELRDAKLADLTDETMLSQFDLTSDIHQCEWRAALDKHEIPAAHQVRGRLLDGGFHGVAYPSFMSPGGTCVALWCWNERGAPRLNIIDPDGRLPKTPASWL